ncbi:MAG: gephyrin-like molybdotransferase receptor GlpR [Nakamurella sp.]
MSSLPTSLIVVGLVIAWLVVLVPMVARRREEVPENTEEGANFRVLRRNSTGGRRRRPVFSRTAMTHRSRAEDDVDGADASDLAPAGDAADVDGQRSSGDDSDACDASGVGSDGAAEIKAGTRVTVTASVAIDDEDDVDRRMDDDAGRTSDRVRPTATDERYERDVTGESVRAERSARRARARYDVSRGEADGAAFANADEDPSARADERERRPVRHGRGGFDPVAADRARAYRFRQRQRVALALTLIAAAGVLAGLFGTGYGYVTAVGSGVLLVLYLAYLRRQVRIEDEIRQRRASRLARAQQIRPGYRPSVAEQVYAHRTGEVPRPGVVDDYQVKSHARQSTPPNGIGYGEPIDLEDSDPAFDDLEYYRPAAFGRRAG